jgi:hypothetical protein
MVHRKRMIEDLIMMMILAIRVRSSSLIMAVIILLLFACQPCNTTTTRSIHKIECASKRLLSLARCGIMHVIMHYILNFWLRILLMIV